MGLKALKIVREEFERNRKVWREALGIRLEDLEARIVDRIEKECIEIPEIPCCGAYSEHFPPGCFLEPGHEGDHKGLPDFDIQKDDIPF